MVKQEQVVDGLLAYIEAEILPAIGGWQRWLASAALVRLYPNMNGLLAELLNSRAGMALGLVSENGLVDVDAAVQAMKETAKKHGSLEVDIPVLGKLRFGEEDFDALAKYIKESGA